MFPKFLNPIEVHSVHVLGLGAIFALFFWPIGFLVFCLNMTLRFISQRLCNYFDPGRYFISDGEDSVFGVKLHGSSKSYIHGYQILKGVPDINLIRSKMEKLVNNTKGYERMRHAMVHKFGYFCWDTKVPFDVTQNVRLLDSFDPEEIVDEDRLLEIMGSLVGTDCGENRPQWEILVVPNYRVEGEKFTDPKKTSHYALIIKLHHGYCDGISFVLLVNNFLSDSPGELPIDPMKGFNNPVWIKAYIWAKILIVGPMNFFKNLAIMMITPNRFRVDRYVNLKILAKSSSVELDTLKKIRVASRTSVTSITLAAVFGAAYKTHLRLFPGKPVPKTMHLGSVGCMLPYSDEKRLSNQFTMWKYAGPLDVKDPKQRLAMTYEEVRKGASQPDPVFNFFMQRALGSLPKILHEVLFSLSGTPLMLSNVPGYTTPVKAFGGEIVDVAAWIPLVTTTGIGLSSQSYCGKLHFSAVTDPQLFPTAADCRQFLDDIIEEIHILAEAYEVHKPKGHATIWTMPALKDTTKSYELDSHLKSPQLTQLVKDVNDNDEVVPLPVLPIEEAECRLRKDHDINVISGKEPVNTIIHGATPVRCIENAIFSKEHKVI